MRTRKKYLPLLVLGMLSCLGLLFYIFFIDPQNSFNAGIFTISPILFFFIMLFTAIGAIGAFLLASIRRGILLSLLISSILLLRLFGFTSFIYILILTVIVLLLELGFRKH